MDGSSYGCSDFEIKSAYNLNGDYIGSYEYANFLCKKKGIKPELSSPKHNVCSIGFSEKDGKWYGWSHRAIFGFKVGSTCKKGDCHYVPPNKQAFLENCVKFWIDDDHRNIKGEFVPEQYEKGVIVRRAGVYVSWEYSDDVPNEKIRGQISGAFSEFPETWGRGEWVAKTMEDAKQMAIDFADGVS